ncbi:MAG TPA: protein-L-isoaspartate(D-aspartate) O-methyltransferase [Candidatus Polarisedimenticolaceae bacterium]|nr:protein-L-isoaspartate(D-aspartate) O-methyltransferase [Candidatus Polarisedimenticolaceae bacterium]
MVHTESLRRERLVRELVEKGIRDPRVLEAMGAVPRERFVQEALRGEAYSGAALPIGAKQTISQPFIVARMCELAAPAGGGKALEIGTGSGYHAAVLSHLFELVYSIERLRELAALALKTLRGLGIHNVHTKIFDGSYGWSEFAPFRAILVTAAAPDVPKPLLEQLEDGGRLILPIGDGEADGEQVLTVVTRNGTKWKRTTHGPCRFVPLRGKYGWPV